VTDLDHEFERELHQSLTLRDPPEDFVDRVVSRIPEQRQVESVRWPIWRWTAAAVFVLAALLGFHFEQEREQRIAGERAREQAFLALRITSSTLQAVNHKIRDHQNTREVQP
jgi:hypothetical protein